MPCWASAATGGRRKPATERRSWVASSASLLMALVVALAVSIGLHELGHLVPAKLFGTVTFTVVKVA